MAIVDMALQPTMLMEKATSATYLFICDAQRPRSAAPSEAREGRARRARPVRWSALLGRMALRLSDEAIDKAPIPDLHVAFQAVHGAGVEGVELEKH